jgi:hypothetical protein
MHERAKTPKEKALAELAIGAFFFAMRSCEYTKVSEPRRTKLLCLRNIRFFRGGTILTHDHPELDTADAVSILFEFQKNDQRDAPITMWRTKWGLLCPVRAWAAIVKRIAGYEKSTKDTPVCTTWVPNAKPTFKNPGHYAQVKDSDMIKLIRAAAADIGTASMGFDPSELGTHSIRSGAAMAMHLAHVPTYTIMLIGRWSSDAFLRYLRVQVMQFTRNISSRMIENHHFFSIPTYDPVAAETDPRQIARDTTRYASSRNCGREALGVTRPIWDRTPFYVHT